VDKGITVRLTGVNVPETTRALATRLVELGRKVEVLEPAHAERLGGDAGAALACRLLSRNGVIVVAAYEGRDPEGDSVEAEIDAHDTPEFAAEKILDGLAEAGIITLESADYTPEEEEEIRKRLADLGYIE
jgi:hypothetical protein